jgi:hypothetical protein
MCISDTKKQVYKERQKIGLYATKEIRHAIRTSVAEPHHILYQATLLKPTKVNSEMFEGRSGYSL